MTSNYEYAVKKTELNSGEVIYTPVCRERSKLIKNKWVRIVKIYDRYVMMELDWEPNNITIVDCKEHIKGHKEYISSLRSKEILKTEIELE